MITHNKECSRVPVTVCTEAVTVLYDSHNLHITGDHGEATVTLDGKTISVFPHRESWLALEQPDPSQVRDCSFLLSVIITASFINFQFLS